MIRKAAMPVSEFIEVVKKTFRYTDVFLLQPLMPPFLISEHKYEIRYKL